MKGLLYSYPKEYALWSGALAWLGVALNSWVGGWDQMIKALVILMWVDFVTGILASLKHKTTNSHVMFWGGVNKILVIVFVGVGVVADGLLLTSEP